MDLSLTEETIEINLINNTIEPTYFTVGSEP